MPKGSYLINLGCPTLTWCTSFHKSQVIQVAQSQKSVTCDTRALLEHSSGSTYLQSSDVLVSMLEDCTSIFVFQWVHNVIDHSCIWASPCAAYINDICCYSTAFHFNHNKFHYLPCLDLSLTANASVKPCSLRHSRMELIFLPHSLIQQLTLLSSVSLNRLSC